MSIKNWSTTPASNNSAAPFGFPENMAPSGVNDAARQVMADVRSQCEDAEWFNWGDTPSRASATTFKIGADVTTRYLVNRAIKCNDGSTLYGIVTASSYSAPDTTVTVNLDSGSLTTSLSSVALAILSPTNRAIPTALGRKGSDVASASTINLSTAAGDFVDVTGTTTITAITSEAAGIRRKVRFTGALTLTHNATSLILPGGANITTAANDRAEFVSLGSGNWLCFSYTKAAGTPIISSQGGFSNVATFSSSGTWTVPTGITKALIELWGAGGGGGGASVSNAIGGGGGGGAFLSKLTTSLTPGSDVTVTIGTGGTAGTTSGTNGAAGGNTTASGGGLASTLTAGGGSGGTGSTSSATLAAGGAGGTATNGDLNFAGQVGGGGNGGQSGLGTGAGGDSPRGGAGGPASGDNTAGAAGTTPGGGGAGGMADAASKAGGAGANGFCVIYY
jgi:hypothetical protein